MRITLKDLESIIDRLNKVTNNPLKTYVFDEKSGKYLSQAGNYHLAGAYGGYELQQMVNEGGGVSCPLNTGYTTKKALYYAIDNYLRGVKIESVLESEVQNG